MKQNFLIGAVVVVLAGALWLWPRDRLSSQPAPPTAAATQAQVPALNSPPNQPAPSNGASPPILVPARVAPQPDAVSAFADWAQRYPGDPSPTAARQGEALAWKRREAMLELIQTDPARALALAVPFRWRLELPPNITRHFEQWVDGRGDYEVAMADSLGAGQDTVYRWVVLGGDRYEAFVFGRRAAQISRRQIPLHGIALEGKLALLAEPIRVLDADEAAQRQPTLPGDLTCRVCGMPAWSQPARVVADIGGEIALFCGREHLDLVNARWVLAESGHGATELQAAAGGGDTWTQGRKTLLYMRVNFPDDLTEPLSEADAYLSMDAVNRFYVEGSYDTTSLTTQVTPLLTLPQVKAWYTTGGPFALLSDAREAARKAGFDTRNYHFDIVSHTSVPGFDWCGLGYVGGKGTWLQCYGAGVAAHELGHNYGLMHANFWDTITNGSTIIGPGYNQEYGNSFDTMGAAAVGANHFGALFKNALGWLPDSAVQDITTNGVYRLYPFDAPLRSNGRTYAAKVRKDFGRDYWMEYRQSFPASASLQNGLLVNWSPWWASRGGTELLDTTPGTITKTDAALVIGRTFSDGPAGVHLTPLMRGATGRDPWIEVQVNTGEFPGNWPPFLGVEFTPAIAAPGELVHFHATAFDLDGDALAYSWSFDDGAFSTNNLPWTFHAWHGVGEHVARCVVSDMKGGVASANVLVTVGQPTGFRVTGVILDANDDPIEGVRVDNGITNTDGYVSSYTDSDGVFILTGLSGEISLEATKYGYSFAGRGWENPLQLTSDLRHVDFLARPVTWVSLALSTNVVNEGNPALQQLVLTRTGSTNEDLKVDLYVTGTAAVPGDLRFTPALASQTNSVTIPAGTNRITFNFVPVNNSTVEPAEVVSVTILNHPDFYIAPQAEALITILDDDQPSRPQISLKLVNDFIPENGVDDCRFVFTRTGSPTGDLPVFYSVSGTATPGVDFPTLLGVVLIPAGHASATVAFRPLDDKNVEPDETVTLTIAASTTYTGAGASATANIVDDDILVVTVTPTGDDLAEPSASGTFTIQREGDLTSSLVVYYTMGGTASNGVDYVSPSGAVLIPAGETSANVTVMARDDSLTEGDESVILKLLPNPGYDVGNPGQATLWLRDNELPDVTVESSWGDPPAEPGEAFGLFKISRGSVVNGNLTVFLAINGTALPGADYLPLDSVVVIPDGKSSVSFDLIPFDDLHAEPTEDVILTLRPGTNYNIGSPGQARVPILDNDDGAMPAVGFTFASSARYENEAPAISVSLSAASENPVTVRYRVLGGTATAADYQLGPGSLTFEPGELAKALPLQIVNDTLAKPDETLRLVLYDPEGATHDGIRVHTFTILDDDTSFLSVTATADAVEATGAPGNFRITRGGGTSSSLLVHFQVTGTASAPSDYSPLGSTVTIPAGASAVNLPVIPVNDGMVELDETVVLTLIGAEGAKIVAPATATVFIFDEDPAGGSGGGGGGSLATSPVVSISTAGKPNAVEGGASGEFVFTRSGPITNALTLGFTLSGTAGSEDYEPLATQITIPAGQTSFTLPVTAVDDHLIEGEETLTASLIVRGDFRAAFPASATVTIQDNDQTVRINPSDLEAAEPGRDLGAFTFTRFGTTNTPLQVFFAIGGTASNGVDYVAITNSFIIPAGSLAATLPIVPLADTLVEGAEKVTLTLLPDAAYSLSEPTNATVTILDDQPMLSIIADPARALEGSGQSGVFWIQRRGNPDYEVHARIAISGTATYGVDYPPFETNVFFNCGVMAVAFEVFPTNELAVEGLEIVQVDLVPDPSYSIIAPSNAVVSIEDASDHFAPGVRLLSPTSDLVFLLGTNANILLEAAVTGGVDPDAPLALTWTNLSGPAPVLFGNTDQTNTTASFTNAGVYRLRFIADDGVLASAADVTVVVDTEAVLAENLLHWSFDDGDGTNVLDSSGFARDGLVFGAATWLTNGAVGGALELSGTNSFVREAADSAVLQGRKQFSLTLWARSATTNRDQGLFTTDAGGTSPTLTLATRGFPSCGSASNTIEATFATPLGDRHLVSTSNRITNGWQHLALTWSNGLAPLLYLNGHPDLPLKQTAPLRGFLTNATQFVVGRGPADLLGSWQGAVDDVRVFPRALSAPEVAAFTATNFGALVVVPTNLTVQVLTPVGICGFVTDDGRPAPPGAVSITWTQTVGPVTMTLTNAQALTNVLEFTQSGEYVFRLIADDGQVKVYADLPVTVVEPTQVSVWATDSEAAELGPDPAEIMFWREGDLEFDLTIYVTLSGTASNGADFVQIPVTDSVVLPAGTQSVAYVITPFLDHRTEGDETFVCTLVSNVAYTVVSGEATVTIHDSPYGMWNIEHFTLEELTDPTLSGEEMDFDRDGPVNFAEYAANRDPKLGETNRPLVTTIEPDPTDGLNHITLTYTRRLPPTDVSYEVLVSDDLVTWNSGPAYVKEIEVTDDGNTLTETVKARLVAPWPNGTKSQFLTVRVRLLSTGP